MGGLLRTTRAGWVVALCIVATAAAAAGTEALPLGAASGARPGEVADPEADHDTQGGSTLDLGGAARTVLSLGFVLSLAVLAAVGAKKLSKGRGGLLGALGPGGPSPSGVLEIMGRYPVGAGQTLVLLRLDRRLLLVHQTTGRRGAQMRTLCEIADPDEVASVLLKTREAQDEAVQTGFREAMRRLETDFSAFDEPAPPTRATLANDEGDRVELLREPLEGTNGADIVTLRSRLHRFIEGARA
ncbi:MAG: hypothetical protein H6810_10550 [Phycisphaeraceae bacterium]|nr:MAG: hypothetical protein H6810_10550 [Phycisphaeraceae bacterium]